MRRDTKDTIAILSAISIILLLLIGLLAIEYPTQALIFLKLFGFMIIVITILLGLSIVILRLAEMIRKHILK